MTKYTKQNGIVYSLDQNESKIDVLVFEHDEEFPIRCGGFDFLEDAIQFAENLD